MEEKIDLTKDNVYESFGTIYKFLPREFLLGNNFDEFLEEVKRVFVLLPVQEKFLKTEWDFKEEILS